MKKTYALLLSALALAALTGCSAAAEAAPDTTTPPAVTQTAPVSDAAATFDDLIALLGQTDAETADALGGGAENWTADHSFFIGRIFETSLLDTLVTVYTTCGNDADHKVESLSVWIADGSQPLPGETRDAWIGALDAYTGTQSTASGPSEGGSLSWKWTHSQTLLNLQLLNNILTLSIQPMIGELH